jgi:hypothetical protein
MTDPRIEKLPAWAREHIKDLQRQRDLAVRSLNEYCDTQTPSPFFTSDMESTGEQKGPTIRKRYIQAYKIIVEHEGVSLKVMVRPGDSKKIELQWGVAEGRITEDIAFVPCSFQAADLIAKENMR